MNNLLDKKESRPPQIKFELTYSSHFFLFGRTLFQVNKLKLVASSNSSYSAKASVRPHKRYFWNVQVSFPGSKSKVNSPVTRSKQARFNVGA